MEIITTKIELQTKGNTDIIDITPKLEQILQKHKLQEGQMLVFVIGSTGGLTTIEYEPGLVKDWKDMLDKNIPFNKNAAHNQAWHDENGHSHLRASLTGPSLNIPFENGKLILGTWQQVVFIDYDNRPRSRQLSVQLMGK